MLQADELDRALDALDAVDIAALTPAELDALVLRLQRGASRYAAVRAKVVAEWTSQKRWATDGSRSAGSRLAKDAHLSPQTAGREVRRARQLRRMPLAAAALAAGDISIDHTDALARCSIARYANLFARDEAMLVNLARNLSFRDFNYAIDRWLLCADDTNPDERLRRRDARRHWHASTTFGGACVANGKLFGLDAETYRNELERLERHEFDADWAAARERLGRAPHPDELDRTPTQRCADAQVEMARRSAAMPADARKPAPLYTVVCGFTPFAETLCRTDNGIDIEPHELLRDLTHADIERIVFSSPSRVIDVGATRRLFKGATRRAIEIRDLHCTHPSGCDVPLRRCHVDHIEPYEAGGLTIQINGRLFCPTHNYNRPHGRPPPPDD